MAVSGEVGWPPLGRNRWPLTRPIVVLLPQRLEAPLQAERRPVDAEHLGVVQEAIENCRSEHLVAEGLRPLVDIFR